MRATPNKCQHVIYLTECPCQRSPKSCPLENHAGNYLCSLLVPLAYSWTQQDTHQLRYRAVATHTPLQTHQNKTNTHIDMTYRPSSDQTGNSASRPLASPLLCLGQNTPWALRAICASQQSPMLHLSKNQPAQTQCQRGVARLLCPTRAFC